MASPRKCCEPDAPAGGTCRCPEAEVAPSVVPTERNRYFTGKYMNARDLTAEQAYLVGKHRLHQRALHGWGIVVGLDVVNHPDPECNRNGWRVVTPGIAVDCFGREIVIQKPVPVRLPDVYFDHVRCGDEEAHRSWEEKDKAFHPTERPIEQGKDAYLLVVKYAESCIEPVPVFADADGCTPRKTSNRVAEEYCFRLVKYDDQKPPTCWGAQRLRCPCPLAKPEPKIPETLEELLAPVCEETCNGSVPLALVRFDNRILNEDVIVDGRRYLPGPLNPQQLTHICDVNWKHDREMTGKPLSTAYEGAHQNKGGGFRLTVKFDRPLHEDMKEFIARSGTQLFHVYFENHDGIRQSAGEEATVRLSKSRTKLHYDVQEGHVRRGMHHPGTVYVTIDCEFLIDHWGRAVDGDHLHGSLTHEEDAEGNPRPRGSTGDGIEGGTFHSWFRLTDGSMQ